MSLTYALWGSCILLEVAVITLILRRRATAKWSWLLCLCSWRLIADAIAWICLALHSPAAYHYQFWGGNTIALLIEAAVMGQACSFATKSLFYAPSAVRIAQGCIFLALGIASFLNFPQSAKPAYLVYEAASITSVLVCARFIQLAAHSLLFGERMGGRALMIAAALFVQLFNEFLWDALHWMFPFRALMSADLFSQLGDLAARLLLVAAFVVDPGETLPTVESEALARGEIKKFLHSVSRTENGVETVC